MLTYGFTSSIRDYADSRRDLMATSSSEVNAAQKNAIARILDADSPRTPAAAAGFSVEGFTDLEFRQVAGANAIMRFGNTPVQNGVPNAWGSGPSAELAAGGDVFFAGIGERPMIGNFHYYATIHETGHALGLSHTFGIFGKSSFPADLDGSEYTVMSYNSLAGNVESNAVLTYGRSALASSFPQSWMMLDIQALQKAYGADFETNAGNTVYKWTPDSGATLVDGAAGITPGWNKIFATIWDGGATDTYDLSAYTTGVSIVSIDLNPGAASRFSLAQTAVLDPTLGERGLAKGNIYNALLHEGDQRSLIENALGGSGHDLISGNVGANDLRGGAGNDTITGGAGNDLLRGASGNDRLSGGANNDRLFGDAGHDQLEGGAGADVLTGGAGCDTFVFRAPSHTSVAAHDIITDFTKGPDSPVADGRQQQARWRPGVRLPRRGQGGFEGRIPLLHAGDREDLGRHRWRQQGGLRQQDRGGH